MSNPSRPTPTHPSPVCMFCSPEGDVAVFCSSANFIASSHIFRVIKDTASLPSRKVHSNIDFRTNALLRWNKVRIAEAAVWSLVTESNRPDFCYACPADIHLSCDTNFKTQLFIFHSAFSCSNIPGLVAKMLNAQKMVILTRTTSTKHRPVSRITVINKVNF